MKLKYLHSVPNYLPLVSTVCWLELQTTNPKVLGSIPASATWSFCKEINTCKMKLICRKFGKMRGELGRQRCTVILLHKA